MRDDLLGYLIGALEPEQEREVERRLEADPQLREALREYRKYLHPLAHDDGLIDAPSGLANRTCDTVADLADHPTVCDVPAMEAAHEEPPAPVMATASFASRSAVEPPPAREGRWGWAETVTTGAIITAASLLIVPAITSSRYKAQVSACQDRMHRLGTSLVTYSRLHNGLFPEVSASGPYSFAGVFASRLRDAKLLDDPTVLACPCRHNADESNTVALPPTLAELQQSADAGDSLPAMPCLSYGYAMGYVDGGVYHTLHNRNRSTYAILADAPGADGCESGNHGCGGQNVWFEDGHSEYLNSCKLSHAGDQIFRNRRGFVGAGIGPDDVVIGAPSARPVIQP